MFDSSIELDPPAELASTPKPTSLLAAAPALVALSLAMLVEMVDNSVLNVALPTIGRDLHSGTSGLQWIISAYSLTFGALLLVGGSLGDRLGRRRVLQWGLLGFAASGALVLFVHSTGALIGVRAASGACAALIAPGTMSLMFRLFDDDELRARAISIIVVVAMTGFAIGPAVSGLAITHVPWQVLLLANTPMALVAWLGVRRGIAADDPAELRAGGADLPGAALSVTAIALGLYAFTLAVEDGWMATTTLACAAAAVVAGVGFVLRERRTPRPMLDLHLFANPTVRGSALLQTTSMLAMVGVVFASTQLFQFAWGWTPLRAGLATLPIVIGMLTAMPVAEAIVRRLGHRRGAALGSALLIAALIMLATTIPVGYPPVAIAMFVISAAMRLVMVTCAVDLLDALPEDQTSIGAALNDSAQELGSTVGVAVVGTIIAALVGTTLPTDIWPAAFTADFTHALQVAFIVLAAITLTIAVIGIRTLTDSKTVEEH